MGTTGEEGLRRSDLRDRRRRSVWSHLVRLGRFAFYIFMAFLCVLMGFVGIANVIDEREETYWGVFTEHYCEPMPRGGCRSIGSWVSDDGRIVKHDVFLDGGVDPGGTIRAGYRPDGILGDEDNNIVHAEDWWDARFWVPWAALVVFGGMTLAQAHRWGDIGRKRHR